MNHIEEFRKAMEKLGYRTREMRNGTLRISVEFEQLVISAVMNKKDF